MTTAPDTDQQPPHRTTSWLPIAVGAAVLVLILAAMGIYLATRGSSPATPTITASTTTSTTQATTTTTAASPKEQAAAAALAAFSRYTQVKQQVFTSGGRDAALLKQIAGQQELIDQTHEAILFRVRGWHSVGSSTITGVTVKSVTLGKTSKTGGADAEVYVASCEDATTNYAVDKTGKNIRATSAPTHYRWTTQVRHFLTGGMNGWLVTDSKGKAVPKC